MGVLFARLPDVPGRAADVGRILVRGISGGRLAAADGQLLSGSANVFVNRQQATMTVRAGGLCRQHTGLRIVASGSYGVSINRQAAARVTDRMDCGAVILEGSSNVFIGAGNPPTLCDLLRADRAKIAQFQVDALAAQAVYQPPDGRQTPPGYRNATDEDLRRLRLNKAMLEHPIDPATGRPSEFRAGVFVNEKTGAPLVAFKGTTMDSWADWKENGKQGLGMDSFYYNQAQKIGQSVADAPNGAGKDARFVGHSLGGGMASAAARRSGLPGTTFNAAGLRHDTVDNALPSEIDGVYVDGEVLRGSQAIPGMPRTAETRSWPLPPDEPGLTEGMRQAYDKDGIIAAGKYAAMRSINLHGMDEVIPALALRQRSNAQAIIANGCG